MTGRVHHIDPHLPDHQTVAVRQQGVELRTVPLERSAFVENLAKCVLYGRDGCADPDLAAKLLLKIGCCGQVVGVDMGFEHPIKMKAPLTDMGHHRICDRVSVRPDA